MKYLGKELAPLTPLDISVVEIIEHDSYSHGKFLYCLVSTLETANSAQIESIRLGFPEVVQSFERWKSGEAGHLYNSNEPAKPNEPAKSHLRIVK